MSVDFRDFRYSGEARRGEEERRMGEGSRGRGLEETGNKD